jgi:hypothetical protein
MAIAERDPFDSHAPPRLAGSLGAAAGQAEQPICHRLVREGRYARRYCGNPAGADGRCRHHRYRVRLLMLAARRKLAERTRAN